MRLSGWTCPTGRVHPVASQSGAPCPGGKRWRGDVRWLRSVFVVWAATAGCHQSLPHLPPGLVPQLSPDLAPGQAVGEVVDSASRSAIGYAKVVLLSDSSDASPASVAAAGYADGVGRFSLQASKPGLYVLQVRHIGHRSVQAPLRLPASGGVVVSVTLARDYDLCSIWPDFCE